MRLTLITTIAASAFLTGCVDIVEQEVQHENQVRHDIIAQCGAADARYMAAVSDQTISPDEVAARQFAAKACWNELQQVDEMQAFQAERRWQTYQAMEGVASITNHSSLTQTSTN